MKMKLKKTNVHNKALFNEINEQIEQLEVILELSTDRESVNALLEIILADLILQYQLEQVNIICDGRNNKLGDVRNGNVFIDIYYKHRNYFNTTHLSYCFSADTTL